MEVYQSGNSERVSMGKLACFSVGIVSPLSCHVISVLLVCLLRLFASSFILCVRSESID